MPLTCLIAAHDPWLIQLLRIFIEESGFRAIPVYESQDVLPVVRKEKPVAVVMQADLPGRRKGYEILQDLQNDPEIGDVPVLLVTYQGHESSENLPAELRRGAAAHLQEPVTYESFQDALHKAGITCPSSARTLDPSCQETPITPPKITHDKLN